MSQAEDFGGATNLLAGRFSRNSSNASTSSALSQLSDGQASTGSDSVVDDEIATHEALLTALKEKKRAMQREDSLPKSRSSSTDDAELVTFPTSLSADHLHQRVGRRESDCSDTYVLSPTVAFVFSF